MIRVGVWEDRRFVGVVMFGRGASAKVGLTWGIPQSELCVLTRVALRDHRTPVSRIVRIALRILRSVNPGIRLVVSYADPAQGHHGGIYQAMGWTYIGQGAPGRKYWINGAWQHSTNVVGKGNFAKGDTPILKLPGKYRYALALDPALAALVESRRVTPAPKRGADEASTEGRAE